MTSQWAHTIDTSDIGCRVGGLRTEVFPGQIITVQRGQHKAPFRVVWSRQLAPNENQAGIEVLDEQTNIWALNSTPAVESREASEVPEPTLVRRQAVHKPAVAQPVDDHQSLLAAVRRRFRLGIALAFMFLIVALGSVLYHQMFPSAEAAEIEPPSPLPPTVRDMARLTPKPHVVLASLTKPLAISPSRVRVAEAPTGRIVYPIAPEDGVSGKVQLELVIAANGLVKQIHLLSGKQPLAQAAAEAVRFWRYASSEQTDRSIERETSVTVSFLGGDAVSLQFPSAPTPTVLARSTNN